MADDLVSEMYIKLSNKKEPVNDQYVRVTLKSIFLCHMKQEKKRKAGENEYTEFNGGIEPEFESYDQVKQEFVLPECLTFVEREILLHRQSMSCRDIEKQYHIHYLQVHRIEKKAKNKIQEWLKK